MEWRKKRAHMRCRENSLLLTKFHSYLQIFPNSIRKNSIFLCEKKEDVPSLSRYETMKPFCGSSLEKSSSLEAFNPELTNYCLTGDVEGDENTDPSNPSAGCRPLLHSATNANWVAVSCDFDASFFYYSPSGSSSSCYSQYMRLTLKEADGKRFN